MTVLPECTYDTAIVDSHRVGFNIACHRLSNSHPVPATEVLRALLSGPNDFPGTDQAESRRVQSKIVHYNLRLRAGDFILRLALISQPKIAFVRLGPDASASSLRGNGDLRPANFAKTAVVAENILVTTKDGAHDK
jgi:hypothetical protein